MTIIYFVRSLSACKEDLELESGIPVMLQLVAKDCGSNDDISVNVVKPNRTAKPTSYDVSFNYEVASSSSSLFCNLLIDYCCVTLFPILNLPGRYHQLSLARNNY